MFHRLWITAVMVGLLTTCRSVPLYGQGDVSGSTEAAPLEASTDDGVDDVLGDDLDQLLSLAEGDVEQLSQVKVVAPALQEVVSTVSRQKSTVGKSPAAVFVITNEMIRRSSARSIPEVLRMVPGVQVHRIDASKWAISIRGFFGSVCQ